MIIGEQFVYVHVPITDGHVPEGILLHALNGKMSSGQHECAASISTANKYIFGFVRNPYDWEYAYWQYTLKLKNWPNITFEDWVRFRYIDDDIFNICSKYQFKDKHIPFLHIRHNLLVNPQAGMYCNMSGLCIANKIYKYEFYNENWEDFFNNARRPDIKVDGITLNEDYKNFYNDFTYETITKYRQFDLKLFGYGFESNGENNVSIEYDMGVPINQNYCFNRDFINL